MSKDKLASCGAVELLNNLRKSQEVKQENPVIQKQSRLEKYIADGKKQKENEKILTEASPIEPFTQNTSANLENNVIYEIDPYTIHRWSGKDRPENELGDIEDLAKSFKQIGQQVPCIVRPSKEHPGEYELIVGECRWHAAKLAQTVLKTIVHELDDRMAALIQAVENEKRNDISEYAKGMSYAKKIEDGVLTQKDLIDILGISKQQVSRLLSFRKIPLPLFEAISDFRKVSARTAEELSRLASKGEKYVEALIIFAPRIKEGKFGWNRMSKEVDKIVNPPEMKIKSNQKVFSKDGRHLFTWRLDNNAAPSIHFPKDVIQLLNSEKIDFDEITQEFKECIFKKIANLSE